MNDETGDRRNFFRRLARQATSRTVEEIDAWARRRAAHWIRPPFALDELEFLLACTRCGACIEACPTGVVFPLPARVGAQFAETPALDLLNKSCWLCADWPCVQACEPGAMRLPVPPKKRGKKAPPMPQLAKVQIDTTRCLPYLGPECGACRDSCPVPGALVWNGERPVVDMTRCAGCARCREVCIAEPKAVTVVSRESPLEPAP